MTIATDSSPPGEYYCPNCEKTFQVGDKCPVDGTRLVKLAARLDAMLGRDLDGRYTILEKLGQGGMGAVYRSSQHSVGREVAIKVVSPHLVSEPEVIKRFLREAKLASRLSHPNAVGVLDFAQTEDGIFYLVMELVTGRTLDLVIKSERVFRPERVVRIGAQVCDALEGAHALSIVHRDLKPANIMLLSSGRDLVKVLDFGLAKSVAPDQASTTMTNAGALLGTPAFMPPELALGQRCDARADLYSLGVTLYLLGSGRLPFESESAHELIAMHGTEAAPPIQGVPPALAKVIDRLLSKDPDRRYQTAAETRDALEAALENRYNTPVPGAARDTYPSIGPFPATSAQFRSIDTGSEPRRRSATEMDRLVNSETMAEQPHAAVHDTALHSIKPRSRMLPLLLVAFAALLIGGGVFVVMTNNSSSDHAAAPPRAPAIDALPQQATEPPKPALDHALDAAPVVPDAAVEQHVDDTPTKPVVKPPVKPHGHPKPPPPKPPKPPPTVTPQGNGSAAIRLPF